MLKGIASEDLRQPLLVFWLTQLLELLDDLLGDFYLEFELLKWKVAHQITDGLAGDQSMLGIQHLSRHLKAKFEAFHVHLFGSGHVLDPIVEVED